MTEPSGQPPARDDLPLPDYDHLPTGSLASRIRTLDAAGIEALLAYERAHGSRAPVLAILQARREGLAAGAEPSGGDPAGPAPEAPPTAASAGGVSPATAGPVLNPPSHGDPTNPAQTSLDRLMPARRIVP